MKAFYQYHIIGYSEYKDEVIHEEGIVFADSYSDAAAQLEEAYDIISIEYLEMMDFYLDRNVIESIQWKYDEYDNVKSNGYKN